MIYNYQWEQMIQWLGDVINYKVSETTKYVDNSYGMGHYCYDNEGNLLPEYATKKSAIKTGSNPDYCVKNIYDLAGNMCEFNQMTAGVGNRKCRGDQYGISAPYKTNYISMKGMAGTVTNKNNQVYGSRLQLYLKIN